MTPDSGEFAGEVEFLNEKTLKEDVLENRLATFVGEAKSWMLMTDGVADDYFPNTPGMAFLYADLALNGIINGPVAPSDGEMEKALQGTTVKSLAQFKKLDITVPGGRVLEAGIKEMRIASVAELAKRLGIEKEQLSPGSSLLGGACKWLGAANPASKPDERLLEWLDSYTVRGSFDDRTLVVMTPDPVG
jgi:hypothetical protein